MARHAKLAKRSRACYQRGNDVHSPHRPDVVPSGAVNDRWYSPFMDWSFMDEAEYSLLWKQVPRSWLIGSLVPWMHRP
jgi:hypothetical protein